jgi:hypothetical protein
MLFINRYTTFILFLIILSILRFNIIVDDIDIYSPKNLNKKLFVADRKYRCIYHYLNKENEVKSSIYNDKTEKFMLNKCKEYGNDILNAKLEKSYNIYYILMKIIYANLIIFSLYVLYML